MTHQETKIVASLTFAGIILLVVGLKRFFDGGWSQSTKETYPKPVVTPYPRHSAPHPSQPLIDQRLKIFIDKYGAEIGTKVYRKETFDGMTPEHLIDIAGRPTDIQEEKDGDKLKEIYVYGKRSSGQIFVFINGRLNSMIYNNKLYA